MTPTERYARSHQAGFDCRLTTFRNTLAYFGHTFSNGVAFGLSGTFCFVYTDGAGTDLWERLPRLTIAGISDQSLEGLATALNCYLVRGRLDQGDDLDAELGPFFRRGVPVHVAVYRPWLRAALEGRPLSDAENDFGFHYVTLTEYDTSTGRVRGLDTDTSKPFELSLEHLRKMWFHDRLRPREEHDRFQPCDGLWYAFTPPQQLKPLLPSSIRHSLSRVVHNFYDTGSPIFGLSALRHFQEDAPRWSERRVPTPGWARSMTLLRLLEGPLSGGGFGRKLYSFFLAEAADVTGSPELRELGKRFRSTADAWRRFVAMLVASARNDPARARDVVSAAVAECVGPLVEMETAQMSSLKHWCDTHER